MSEHYLIENKNFYSKNLFKHFFIARQSNFEYRMSLDVKMDVNEL